MAFTQGHALIIGVGAYQHEPDLDVPVVVEDARAVARVIQNGKYCGYPEKQVEVLPVEQTTHAGTLDALERLAQRAGEEDTVFLFYCGHGALGTDGNYYLVSQDAHLEAGRVVAGSGVSEVELVEKLRALKARRAFLVFNTCFSGSISPTLAPAPGGLESASLSPDTASALLGTGSGRIILTACGEEQYSYLGSGALTIFTQALVDGLHGKGVANTAGFISAYQLYEQVYLSVSESTANAQQPELTMLKNRGPFAVALFRGASTLGNFDESETALPSGVVHAVPPEKAQRAFTQIIQVRDGAVAYGKNAKAVGKGGMLIEGNVGGDVIGSGWRKSG